MATEIRRITYNFACDGSTAVFPINWPYLDKAFVKVALRKDGEAEATDITASCNWLSDTQIEISPAPSKGSTLIITRNTVSDRPLAVFQNGSTQLAEDLNTVSTQFIHIVEESRDFTEQVQDYVGQAEGYLEQLGGLANAVNDAETAKAKAENAANSIKTLSIAVADIPHGSHVAGTYNKDTGMLTLYVPEGKPGLKGEQGPRGDTGDVGPVGPQGPQGVKGDSVIGPQGVQGPAGATGPQGRQGIHGADGAQGAQGAQGIQGIQGAKGEKGDTGAAGPQGPQGAKGEKGDTGEQGERGPVGAPGQSPLVDIIDCGGPEDTPAITIVDGGLADSF